MNGRLATCCGFIVLCLSGCASYHWDRGDHLPFSSIHIAPVGNFPATVQVHGLLWEQLCREFTLCPFLRLEPDGSCADATLAVEILSLSQDVATLHSADANIVSAYDVTLCVSCTLVDNRSGNSYFTGHSICTSVDVPTGKNYVECKYQSMPALVRELAWKIRNLVVASW